MMTTMNIENLNFGNVRWYGYDYYQTSANKSFDTALLIAHTVNVRILNAFNATRDKQALIFESTHGFVWQI